jgi:hypothetical protein
LERHGLSALPPGPLSPRLLAARASPRPDPPRTPLVAPPGRAAVGVTAMRSERAYEPATFPSSTRPRRAEEGRLPHPSAKRRCVPLHPRCLPSKEPPFGGWVYPQLVANLWSMDPAPFQSPRHSNARTVRGWCDDSASTSNVDCTFELDAPDSRRKRRRRAAAALPSISTLRKVRGPIFRASSAGPA